MIRFNALLRRRKSKTFKTNKLRERKTVASEDHLAILFLLLFRLFRGLCVVVVVALVFVRIVHFFDVILEIIFQIISTEASFLPRRNNLLFLPNLVWNLGALRREVSALSAPNARVTLVRTILHQVILRPTNLATPTVDVHPVRILPT